MKISSTKFSSALDLPPHVPNYKATSSPMDDRNGLDSSQEMPTLRVLVQASFACHRTMELGFLRLVFVATPWVTWLGFRALAKLGRCTSIRDARCYVCARFHSTVGP